jgi:hypothetical protein
MGCFISFVYGMIMADKLEKIYVIECPNGSLSWETNVNMIPWEKVLKIDGCKVHVMQRIKTYSEVTG